MPRTGGQEMILDAVDRSSIIRAVGTFPCHNVLFLEHQHLLKAVIKKSPPEKILVGFARGRYAGLYPVV